MRYLSLEALSHLATSDLSREAVKKHQDIVMKALNVRAEGRTEGEGKERDGGGGRVLQNIFTITWMYVHYVWEELLYFSLSLSLSLRRNGMLVCASEPLTCSMPCVIMPTLRPLLRSCCDTLRRQTTPLGRRWCVCVCVCVCVGVGVSVSVVGEGRPCSMIVFLVRYIHYSHLAVLSVTCTLQPYTYLLSFLLLPSPCSSSLAYSPTLAFLRVTPLSPPPLLSHPPPPSPGVEDCHPR